jgi:hypothetical protein
VWSAVFIRAADPEKNTDSLLPLIGICLVTIAVIFAIQSRFRVARAKPTALSFLRAHLPNLKWLLKIWHKIRDLWGKLNREQQTRAGVVLPWTVSLAAVTSLDILFFRCYAQVWHQMHRDTITVICMYFVLITLIGAMVWRVTFHGHRQDRQAIKSPPTTTVFIAVCVPLYYMSLIFFAHGFYPFMPASRGGGDFTTTSHAILYLKAPASQPFSSDDMVAAGPETCVRPRQVVVIADTDSDLFVAESHDNGGPFSWRREWNHRPNILQVRRTDIDRIAYLSDPVEMRMRDIKKILAAPQATTAQLIWAQDEARTAIQEISELARRSVGEEAAIPPKPTGQDVREMLISIKAAPCIAEQAAQVFDVAADAWTDDNAVHRQQVHGAMDVVSGLQGAVYKVTHGQPRSPWPAVVAVAVVVACMMSVSAILVAGITHSSEYLRQRLRRIAGFVGRIKDLLPG